MGLVNRVVHVRLGPFWQVRATGWPMTELAKADDFASIVQEIEIRCGQTVLMSNAVDESHGLSQ